MSTGEAYRIAYIRGGPDDDAGPELADAATAVLDVLLDANGGPEIELVPVDAGTHCHETHGTAIPEESLETIRRLGIVFKAPTAGEKVPHREAATLILRRELATYANLNELRSYPGMATAIHPGIDILLVRENSETLLAKHSASPSPDLVLDLRFTSREATERIARLAFQLAERRRKRLTVCAFPVTIQGDIFFVRICREIAEEHPNVELLVRKVDAFAGLAVTRPEELDVVLAPNDWGSVMTDLLGAVCGSVGLSGRANIGESTGLFEPIHGTVPGKAGKGTVNPISQIISAKLMLQWIGEQFADPAATRAGDLLQRAVSEALSFPEARTSDLGGTATTTDVVHAVSDRIVALAADH